jgi:hypothetical protein
MFTMKNLILTLIIVGYSSSWCAAQTLLSPHPIEIEDSIRFHTPHATLIINKADVQAFVDHLDTLLPQKAFTAKHIYRNIQFHGLDAEEVKRHFRLAKHFWIDQHAGNLEFFTERITYLWNENADILLPYLDEMISELLEFGMVQIEDRSNGQRLDKYLMEIQDIHGTYYKTYRFVKGKIIWKEADVFLEELAHAVR